VPIIATVWWRGHKGRAPKKEERLALAVMKSHDTPEQLVQVPCGIKVNGVPYIVYWRDNPTDNLPDGIFDDYYASGRCANCGRLWGDHQYRGTEYVPMYETLDAWEAAWLTETASTAGCSA
jgi:hypothetical protein